MATKHKHHDHHHVVKNLMSFFILVIAFSILLVFVNNSENIIEGNNFKTFMTLAVIGAALLIGLLYLVNNSDTKGVTKVSAKSKTKKRN